MKIVLDMLATQSESRLRGIGRYSMSLALAMLRNPGPHDFFACLNHVFPETIEPLQKELGSWLPPENILVYRTLPRAWSREPVNLWRNNAGQLIRESYLASLDADVVHTFSMFEGWGDSSVLSSGLLPDRAIHSATIHDLIPYAEPDIYLPTPNHRAWYMDQLESLRRCDLLLSNSEYTRQTAIEFLGFPAKDIISVSAGADSIFCPADIHCDENRQRLAALGIDKPFIMYAGVIGREEPRKNFLGLLEAYSLLPEGLRENFQLVLVGRYNVYSHQDMLVEADRLGIRADQLLFTDRVDDSDLILLYSACELFVFPSLEEGFGLPALEAMQCGATVIGSNSSSVPEVIGNPEALFDPASPANIAGTIEKVLTDDNLRESIRRSAARHVSTFDWDISARKAIAALEEKHADGKRSSQIPAESSSTAGAVLEVELGAALGAIGPERLCRQDLVYCAQAIIENQPQPARRKLLLDVSELVRRDALTGIQRVVRSLLAEFTRAPIPDTDAQLVYLDGKGDFRVLVYDVEQAGVVCSSAGDELLDVARGDIYLGIDLDLEGIVLEQRNDFLEYHRRRGLEIYYVVYDLLPILQGQDFHVGVQERFPTWLREVAGHADGLVCISRAVMAELEQWLQVYGPRRSSLLKLGYFHLGADIESSAPSSGMADNAPMVLQQIAERPSILMVATIEPRKGQQQALAAMEFLWAEGEQVNLVLVGKSGWNMAAFERQLDQHPQRNKQLFWLKGVSDEMLHKLYEASTLLLAASTGEGFGLPLIEAAQHELPILARDIPVFREVAGEHAVYFSGERPEDLRKAIAGWMQSRANNAVPTSAGMPWLSWSDSAQHLSALVLENNGWSTTWCHAVVPDAV